MPLVTVEGPEIEDKETKRRLVRRITEDVAEIYGFEEEKISVLIKENQPDNVGVGGKLVSDKSGDTESKKV